MSAADGTLTGPTGLAPTLRRLRGVAGYWALVVVLAVLGAGAGLLLAAQRGTTYGSSATVFFSLPSGDSLSEVAQGATYTQDLMESYAAVVTKPAVLQPVAQRLGLDESPARLATRVSAKVRPGTVLLEIDATAPTARGAADLAGAVTDEFSSAVRELAPVGKTGQRLVDLRTVASAATPAHPLSRHLARDAVLGAVAGAVLALLVALGREALSPRVRSAEDVRDAVPAPVLAVLPRRRSEGLVPVGDDSAYAEGVRRLRSVVLATARRRDLRTVVVADVAGRPAVPVAADLAVVLGEAGVPVLVSELDLQRPVLATAFGVEAVPGLADVLSGGTPADAAVRRWRDDTPVLVLPAGAATAQAHRLIASPQLPKALAGEAGRAELTLLDAGAGVYPADTGDLAAHVDGTVLVVPAGSSRRDLVDAVAGVEGAGGSVLGVVLTGGRWSR